MKKIFCLALIFAPFFAQAELNPAWVECLTGLSRLTLQQRPMEVDFADASYQWDGKIIRSKSPAPWTSDRTVWSLSLYGKSARHEGRPNVHFPSQELERVMRYMLIESYRELMTIPAEPANWRKMEIAMRSCQAVNDIRIRGHGILGHIAGARLDEIRKKFGTAGAPRKSEGTR